MRTKLILYLFIPIAILGVWSCKTSKKSLSSANQIKETKLNAVEKHDFEENYFDGIKSKLIENDVTKAISSFKKCVSIDNQNAGALYELAKLYMQLRNYAETQKLLEDAIHIEPYNKWYIIALIETYTQQSNYEKAILTLRKLADLEPYNIDIFLKLSDLFLLDKQPLKAIKVLDGIEQLSGILPEVTDRKRGIYLSMNKFDEAVNEIQKLINAFPYNTDYLKSLIDMYRVYNKTENILPLYQKILSIDSNDGKAQMKMAEYYHSTNKPDLARQYSEKVLRNQELGVNNKLNYLMSAFIKGKITPESKHLLLKYTDLLLEEYPANSEILTFKADVYFNTNQPDSALIVYLKSIEADPSSYVIWKQVIMIYFEQKNYNSAVEKCNQAIQYFPTNPEIYFYEGIAFMQLKKNLEAARIFETGLKYVVKNKQLLQQFYANMGEVYHTLADYENSDKYYDKAVQIDPNDGFVLNNFAYFLSLRKLRLEDAKRMSERSIQLDPENPANLDTYGWILFLLKDYVAAEKQISKALQKTSNDADILDHYGDILFQLGQIDKAVESWQKAKSNGSTSEKLDKKIKDRMLYE